MARVHSRSFSLHPVPVLSQSQLTNYLLLKWVSSFHLSICSCAVNWRWQAVRQAVKDYY